MLLGKVIYQKLSWDQDCYIFVNCYVLADQHTGKIVGKTSPTHLFYHCNVKIPP